VKIGEIGGAYKEEEELGRAVTGHERRTKKG